VLVNRKLINTIIEWDVNNWSKLIKYWQPIVNSLPKSAKILCIGERNGGLTLWLAMQGFNVVCTDRVYPTSKAIEIHKSYNVNNRIAYKEYDILEKYPDDLKFDLIIAKSVLGGIKNEYTDSTTRNKEARIKAIGNLHEALTKNGTILFAENMKGSLFLDACRKFSGKKKGWHYFTVPEIKELFQPFNSLNIKYFGLIPTYGNGVILNKLIYLFNYLLQPVTPNSFKYISFVKGIK
jgi:hypothetical protein